MYLIANFSSSKSLIFCCWSSKSLFRVNEIIPVRYSAREKYCAIPNLKIFTFIRLAPCINSDIKFTQKPDSKISKSKNVPNLQIYHQIVLFDFCWALKCLAVDVLKFFLMFLNNQMTFKIIENPCFNPATNDRPNLDGFHLITEKWKGFHKYRPT